MTLEVKGYSPAPGNRRKSDDGEEFERHNGADVDGSDAEAEEYVETRCGLGNCRPSALQRCNNPKVLCACLCVYTLVQSFAVNGINNVNTTSYERRFELTSSSVGWISSCFDISAAICGVVIGFCCNKGNKGRVLTIAFVTSSLGSLCMFLPHFFTDRYKWGQGNTHMCSATGAPACSEEEGGALPKYLVLFILGQLMHGVGGSTLITVGYSFIDDSVPASSSPMYISIIGVFTMLGPMVGFLVGGSFLNLYVDFDTLPPSKWGLTPSDPRWVGAWWVGFLISSTCMFTFALPFSLFGTELPAAQHVRDTRVSETHNDGSAIPNLPRLGEKVSVRSFPVMLVRLLKNPAFMCVSFAGAFMGLVTISLATFLPKYIQNVFETSASTAATFAGIIIIPGAAFGQVFGGFVIRYWNMKVKQILKFIMLLVCLAILSNTCFFINCEKDSLVVSTVGLKGNSTTRPGGLVTSCSRDCNCDGSVYQVVCDQNGLKYFSPCLAGCQTTVNKNTFTDCRCVSTPGNVSSVSIENCGAPNCYSLLYIFLAMFLITAITISSTAVPAMTVVLRCAHEDERTFALGMLNFIARVIGTIPGPILYGTVIDATCVVWGSNCGTRTSCWRYDNVLMGENLAMLGIGFTTVALFFFLMAYKLYKAPVGQKKNPSADGDSIVVHDDEAPVGTYGSVIATRDIEDTHL